MLETTFAGVLMVGGIKDLENKSATVPTYKAAQLLMADGDYCIPNTEQISTASLTTCIVTFEKPYISVQINALKVNPATWTSL